MVWTRCKSGKIFVEDKEDAGTVKKFEDAKMEASYWTEIHVKQELVDSLGVT